MAKNGVPVLDGVVGIYFNHKVQNNYVVESWCHEDWCINKLRGMESSNFKRANKQSAWSKARIGYEILQGLNLYSQS